MADEQTLLAQQGDTNGAAGNGGEAQAAAPVAVPAAEGAAPAAAEQTPQEAPAAETKPAQDKAPAEQQAKEVAVPEKYEFKLPEGKALDDSLAQSFSERAKELKLTQDGAQKLVDLYVAQQEQQVAAFNKQRADWRAEFQKDPKHPELLDNAKKALRLASPEERAFLADSYLGDHPLVLRYLAKVGALTREDTLAEGAGAGRTQRSAAEILYGKPA